MSIIDRILFALHRVPRGFPADGRSLGLGLAAAIDAERAKGPRDEQVLADDSRDDTAGVAR